MLRNLRLISIARQGKNFSTTISGEWIESHDDHNQTKVINRKNVFSIPKTFVPRTSQFIETKTERRRRRRLSSSERIYEKPRKFYENCKSLRIDSSLLSTLTLSHLPMNSLLLNEEGNFVDTYFLPWWFAFERRYKNLEVKDVMVTLIALKKINESTNGDLMKLLQFHRLESLIDYIFDKIIEIYPKSLMTLLSNLRALSVNATAEEKLSLKNKLTSIFPVYVMAILDNRVQFGDDFESNLGTFLFKVVEFGLEKPSNACMQQILSICWRSLTRNLSGNSEDEQNFDCFTNLNRVATILLFWKVDVNKFSMTFWPRWFEKTSRFMIGTDSFARAMYLKNSFMIALSYRQENEFNYVRPLWIKKFRANFIYLPKEYVQFMTEELKNYLNDPMNKDSTAFKGVLEELELCLNKY